MNATAISQRPRFAITREVYLQARILSVLNEHLQRVGPYAKPTRYGALSRICTGARGVQDAELHALTSALNEDMGWLLGRRLVDPNRDR